MEMKKDVSKYITTQIPYIRRTIISLNSVGCWPHGRLGFKSWFSDFRNSKFLFILWFLAWVLAALNFVTNKRNISFSDQLRIYVMFMLTFVALHRIPVAMSKNFCDLADSFLKATHLIYFKNKNSYADKMHNDVHKLSTFITILLHCELYCGALFFNLTPMFNNYRHGMFNSIRPENGTFEHSAYYWLPFDYRTEFKGYLFIVIINFFISYDISASISCTDLFLFILMFHVWGHVKILKNNLHFFPRPEMKLTPPFCKSTPWYTAEESQKVTCLIIESLEHFRVIKTFMNQISQTFEAMICINLFFYQVTGCIMLVQCSKMDAESLGFFGILTFTMFQQLIQLSVIFEIVGSQIETISDSVYNLPWECMDVKNRKMVLFYLMITQQPMQLKALGMIPVGVQTMASILKTSISYFMLLRTTTPNE